MQVARTRYMGKISSLSFMKRTKWSGNLFRPVVQAIFAVIATTSFILIVIMACKEASNQPARPPEPLRCTLRGCMVTCNQTPYYGRYENEIIMALTVAEATCNRIVLQLNEPFFEGGRLPSHWLAPLRSNIHELVISGGNLNHLPSQAFISQFTSVIKTLTLQNLLIKSWHANSLVGFSSLLNLNVVDCQLQYIQANSLRAVDDTLLSLSIVHSGRWDPANITGFRGFENLRVVDFSNNDFHNILDHTSFVGLENCEILYLNACGIVSIGAGTFDHLKRIQVLYLNNNRIVTIPRGLFYNIVALNDPRPRISLQDNLWHCSCAEDDLRQLVRKEMLLVESTCIYPVTMHGKTFTEYDDYCNNDTEVVVIAQSAQYSYEYELNTTYIHGTCNDYGLTDVTRKSSVIRSFQLVTPKQCSLNKTNFIDVSLLTPKRLEDYGPNNKTWLKFSYFLRTSFYTAIQIGLVESSNYGLLWFQSECPYEMYCMDSMPASLRIFDVEANSQFTFCPLRIDTGDIEEHACVAYTVDSFQSSNSAEKVFLRWLIYTTTVLFGTVFGAIIVYGLIRVNPTLLRGSKRILFVKHKAVDALVLPPKVPLRNDIINDTCGLDKDIFTLSASDALKGDRFNTMKSIRSNKSASPSYISAVHPSEDQLAEWRIGHHFNNDISIRSKSELSSLWLCGDAQYCSLEGHDTTYESLK